ncbi:MAG: IS30 family transposase [Proteobacteria bacterium]|nr:IS30 family transposase [Pseudomonadota bacterium]
MGKRYSQLQATERAAIMLMLEEGKTVRAMARRLGRSAGTISREIRRQPYHGKLPYEATRAAAQAFWQSRQSRNRAKLRPGTALFQTVARHLRQGWSPLQIAGRLRRMHPDAAAQRVCHETIYVALYVLPRGELRRELLACLRQGHKTRRPRSRGTDRRNRIAEELRIAARPAAVAERRVPGHWEGDLLKGAHNRSAVGTLVERTSRLVMIARMEAANALAAQHAFERLFAPVPPALRKTLTYDRGSEMARHRELTRRTGVKVYFADPYSPWQRGSNENTNGLIRQYLPKGTDLSRYSQADLDAIAHLLNTRPRKVLDFQTPREVFDKLLNRQLANTSTVALRR